MLTTSEQLQEHVDTDLLKQLSSESGDTLDDVRIQRALERAWGIVDGYIYTLTAAAQPPASTLEAHQVALAVAALAGNRQGEELKAIRAAAKDSLEYLRGLSNREPATQLGLTHCAPEPVFTDGDLFDFGRTDGGES